MKRDFFPQKRLEGNDVIPPLMLLALLLFFSNLSFAQCTSVVGGAFSSTTASICAGSNTILNVNGGTTGTGIIYQWESRREGSNTNSFVPIIGATGSSYTLTTTQSNYGVTIYRRKTTCSSSGTNTYTKMK